MCRMERHCEEGVTEDSQFKLGRTVSLLCSRSRRSNIEIIVILVFCCMIRGISSGDARGSIVPACGLPPCNERYVRSLKAACGRNPFDHGSRLLQQGRIVDGLRCLRLMECTGELRLHPSVIRNAGIGRRLLSLWRDAYCMYELVTTTDHPVLQNFVFESAGESLMKSGYSHAALRCLQTARRLSFGQASEFQRSLRQAGDIAAAAYIDGEMVVARAYATLSILLASRSNLFGVRQWLAAPPPTAEYSSDHQGVWVRVLSRASVLPPFGLVVSDGVCCA